MSTATEFKAVGDVPTNDVLVGWDEAGTLRNFGGREEFNAFVVLRCAALPAHLVRAREDME